MTYGGQTIDGSVRRRSAWLVALPLLAAGSLLAHQLSYLIVAGDQAGALLAETGHGYLAHLPAGALLATICVALGLGLAALDRLRDRTGRAVPAWVIAVVPILGFALQEHLERLAESGHVPWTAALDPTFLVGVALQLPFCALAFLAARWLLRGVTALVTALRARRPQPRRGIASGRQPLVVPRMPRVGLAFACAPRGPPAFRIV